MCTSEPRSRASRRAPALLAALLALGPGLAAAGETLFSVLEKNLAARGGYSAWKSVETLRMTGALSGSETESVPVVLEIMRPNLLRFEFQLRGQQVVQAFDGSSGWRLVSDGVTAEIQDLTEAELAQFTRTADFEGPLLDWRDKAYSLRYLGRDEGEGGSHLIEVTRPAGDMLNLYLDAETFLTRVEQVFASSTAPVPTVETRLSEYQRVDGLALPYSFAISFPQTGVRQLLTLDSVELNVPLSASRFARPEPVLD